MWLEALARERAGAIWLDVYDNNPTSALLHRSLGFEPVTTVYRRAVERDKLPSVRSFARRVLRAWDDFDDDAFEELLWRALEGDADAVAPFLLAACEGDARAAERVARGLVETLRGAGYIAAADDDDDAGIANRTSSPPQTPARSSSPSPRETSLRSSPSKHSELDNFF